MPATDPGACSAMRSEALQLLSPQSASIVTSARPRFRWSGGTGPYLLQVCADRLCKTMLIQVTSEGAEITLPYQMPPGYWFWRVRAAGGSTSNWTLPWEVRVRRRFEGYRPVANTSVGGFSDYNGDGYPDVAALGSAPMIYLGGPDGISANRTLKTEPNTGPGMAFLEPQVDVNGDGFTDLSSRDAISVEDQSWPTYAVRVQFGTSNGLAAYNGFVDVITGYYPLRIDEPVGLGDLDGDGFGDLIMQFRYGAAVIRGCAPRLPKDVWARLSCGSCQLQQVATGDFDGDGRTDFIFADGAGINIYGNTPDLANPVHLPGMSGLWVIDFNYDGYSDLIIKDEWPANTLRAYAGGPNGLSSTLSAVAQPTAFVVVGDFDGDGYWDVIEPDRTGTGSTLGSVAYGGPRGWGAPVTRTTPLDPSLPGSGPIVVDLNADGYDDLLIRGPGDTAISWYAGSPTGLATLPTRVLMR